MRLLVKVLSISILASRICGLSMPFFFTSRTKFEADCGSKCPDTGPSVSSYHPERFGRAGEERPVASGSDQWLSSEILFVEITIAVAAHVRALAKATTHSCMCGKL